MVTDVWKRDLFVNDNIPFLFNKEIIEYDMKEAGFSLTKEFNLLPDDIISKLNKYGKEKRKVELGKIQRDNKEYAKLLKESFKSARKMFFELNNLDVLNIVSIKKDAIFTTKKCSVNNIGEHILFRPKNIYTSYIQLSKNMEFYYNETSLDIKGLNDEAYKLHEEYMISFIKKYFKMMETSDKDSVLRFVRNFIDKYKRKELEVGYYRVFNSKSNFELLDSDDFEFMDYWEEDKDDLDISYNYMNILLKLAVIPL